MITTQRYTEPMTDTEFGLANLLEKDGWTLLDPIDIDEGVLHRAIKQDSIVQAKTIGELCRRIWDIEENRVARPRNYQLDSTVTDRVN